MKVTYKGKLDNLVPAQNRKLEAKLAKLSKLIDGRDEREAHVILTTERHVQQAEITLNLRDHAFVGIGAAPDQFTALTSAIEKLEKQVRKLHAKRRDTKRGPEKSLKVKPVEAPFEEEPEPAEVSGFTERKIFRANHRADQKPLTLEEALMAIEDGRDYIVYRDAETDRLSVLLRRRDGHFDLVEA